ncbi:hypothetical protein LCGC14_1492200 [marine sediment metagenome]|uniref:Uncharacterized protein n=1 Tax=marine sediment metagenome TaxID=412755 RepID=A0A0F9J757_9ZZZZ
MNEEFDYIKCWLSKGIIVYSFELKGKCPNCGYVLMENEFGNWICDYCQKQSLYDRYNYIKKLRKKWQLNDI